MALHWSKTTFYGEYVRNVTDNSTLTTLLNTNPIQMEIVHTINVKLKIPTLVCNDTLKSRPFKETKIPKSIS